MLDVIAPAVGAIFVTATRFAACVAVPVQEALLDCVVTEAPSEYLLFNVYVYKAVLVIVEVLVSALYVVPLVTDVTLKDAVFAEVNVATFVFEDVHEYVGPDNVPCIVVPAILEVDENTSVTPGFDAAVVLLNVFVSAPAP